MSQISHFIGAVVPIAQNVTGDGDESAAPKGGGGFTDYALVSLHCLRIYLDTSYRMTIDLLKEMAQITGEIGLKACIRVPVTLMEEIERFDPVDRDVEGIADLPFFERLFDEADVARVVLDEQDVRWITGIVLVNLCDGDR